jgi:Acyl-CoA carboxylase epsilon subunit
LTAPEERPFLHIVRGDATPEEVAALVAVIASMGGTVAPAPPKPRSTWADPARRMRTTLPHGPGAWRASGLPH